MFNQLPQGIKISITRSITTAFEQYMKDIEWKEDKYSLEDFVTYWREYAMKSASWYTSIDEEVKVDPSFHQQLADKINDTIEKVFTQEPTQEQMEELERLIKEKNLPDVDYSCKLEAKYHIDRLS